MKIDKKVKRLVAALNQIPGVDTFSSCGGHENPTLGQVPHGCFTVSLDIEQSAAGWRALERITWAIWETDPERIRLTTWPSGDTPDTLAFSLAGIDGVSTNRLAAALVAPTGATV